MEQFPGNVKRSPEGKIYEYEKDGVFYGGEYLPEAPENIEIKLDEDDEDSEDAPQE